MKFRISKISDDRNGSKITSFNLSLFVELKRRGIIYKEEVTYAFPHDRKLVNLEWVIEVKNIIELLEIAENPISINGIIITVNKECSVPNSIEIFDGRID